MSHGVESKNCPNFYDHCRCSAVHTGRRYVEVWTKTTAETALSSPEKLREAWEGFWEDGNIDDGAVLADAVSELLDLHDSGVTLVAEIYCVHGCTHEHAEFDPNHRPLTERWRPCDGGSRRKVWG